MVPRLRSYEESAASLARAMAGEDPSVTASSPDAADGEPVLRTAPRDGRFVWPYVAVLLLALGAVAVFSPTAEVAAQPGLLVMLVVCVVGLDLIRIDVFERNPPAVRSAVGIPLRRPPEDFRSDA